MNQKNRQIDQCKCANEMLECLNCANNRHDEHCVEQPESGKKLTCEKHNRILIGKERCVDCDKEHKIGEHGAVGYVTQEGRVCVECSRPIEDKEVPTSMSGAKEEGIDWKQKFYNEWDAHGGIETNPEYWLIDFISQVREEARREERRWVASRIIARLPTRYDAPLSHVEMYQLTEKLVEEYLSKEGGIE